MTVKEQHHEDHDAAGDVADPIEQGGPPAGRGNGSTSYVVSVRTPAGFTSEFRVTDKTRVETLTKRAVAYFTSHAQLTHGNYRLVLVRNGSSTDLTPSARLGESGVVAADVLSLVSADPQVDG